MNQQSGASVSLVKFYALIKTVGVQLMLSLEIFHKSGQYIII